MAGNPRGNGDGSIGVSENLHSLAMAGPHDPLRRQAGDPNRRTAHSTQSSQSSQSFRGVRSGGATTKGSVPGSGLPAGESTLLGPPQKPLLDQHLENDIAHLAVETPKSLDLVSRQQQPGHFEELAT